MMRAYLALAPSEHNTMLRTYLALVILTCAVSGHDYFPGKCPTFSPMPGFDWRQFSNGIWYVTQKFATKSSCLTYEFKTDELGFKSIEQVCFFPHLKDFLVLSLLHATSTMTGQMNHDQVSLFQL